MAKAGMRRPSPSDPKNHGTENRNRYRFHKNEQDPVEEVRGKSNASGKIAKRHGGN